MSAKIVRLGAAAGEKLAGGVGIAADLVATTLGPAGRAVLVGRTHAPPLMLRNGYAVVQQLDLADGERQAGVLIMRELAWRTQDQAGDGTSTAIVMARAFLCSGAQAILAGISRAELQDVIDAHCSAVVASLEAASRPVGTGNALACLATQAAGGDPAIGALIADAHARIGSDGVVVVEEGHGSEDQVRVDPGLHFDQGWISPHFGADQAAKGIEIDDPLILLHLGPINEIGPIMPALEMIAKADRGLVLIAETVGGDALSTLVVNKQRAGFKVAAVKAPGVGLWRPLMLDDIAVATGGMVIGEAFGSSLERLRPQMAGRAQTVRITQTGTTIIGGHADPAALGIRTREIRDAIAREKHLSFDRDQHRKRLARLEAGIVTVRIGGVTATEIAQRFERARAASAAVRSAQAGGVLAGGSAALIHAGWRAEAALPQNLAGRMVGRMFAAALRAPLCAIADNAGLDGCAVVRRVAAEGGNLCFDAGTRSFVACGALFDPMTVLRAALVNSVSAASRMLGVGAVVAPAPLVAESGGVRHAQASGYRGAGGAF
jgi:chaperonin GroEL